MVTRGPVFFGVEEREKSWWSVGKKTKTKIRKTSLTQIFVNTQDVEYP